MKATRERQERFMDSFGARRGQALASAVAEMLAYHGAHWLTDEQMDEIVSKQVEDARYSNRNLIRNRNRRSA